ncbi:MAG: glycosyl transferase, partial [Akkermansiaceae bacterium]|nr:glycosyl transferase [Akkermansiaceae bacterium]
KSLFPAYLIVGIALFLAIAAPWHILAARANHDFLWFYFVHEHFLRFTTTIHGRYEPWWYLLPCVIGGLFPWIFFSWQALSSALKGGWKARQENSVAWFLVIWIVFIVAFFSKSQSKLIPYVLPVFPAAAVLLGSCLGRIWEQRSALTIRKTAIGFGGVAVALTVGLLFYKAPKSHPEFAGHLTMLKVVLASGFVASIAVIFTGVRKRAARTMLTGVATTGVTLLIGANLIGSIYDSGSTKSLAMVMKPRLNAGDEVYCLMLYPQDLPLYLERMVKVVDYKGELEFGINAEPEISSRYFLSQAQFMAEWKNPGTHYAILRKWEYAKWFPEDGPSKIAEKGRYLLVTNHPADKAP